MLNVPYVVYWLIVKDFLYNMNYCGKDYTGTGYCLSPAQCSNIAYGKNIGSCENEISGSVCCKITLSYYNETYLLNPIFAEKSQINTAWEVMLFNANTYSRLKIDYGNKGIKSKRKKKMVFFDSDVHVCDSPDRIIWSISTSYSRESRDLMKQSSGRNYLYVVALDKLHVEHTDKNVPPECLTIPKSTDREEIKRDNESKFYLKLNSEVLFPLRLFFTPEIQKRSNMNFTYNIKTLFEAVDLEKRRSRSIHYGAYNLEDSSCETNHWEVLHSVEREKDHTLSSESETINHIYEQVKKFKSKLEKQHNIDSIDNFLLYSESILEQLMKTTDGDKAPTHANEEITPNQQVETEPISESNKLTSKLVEENLSILISTPPNALSMKDDYIIDTFSKQSQTYNHNMKSEVRESTHDRQKSVQSVVKRNLRKIASTEASHDMLKSIDIEYSVDMGAMVESTNDMRMPAHIHSSHDMREPVKTERQSVQREPTHDMRKPVSSDESHDLRWPILEGESDLRSFNSGNEEFRNNLSIAHEKDGGLDINVTLHSGTYKLDCKGKVPLEEKTSDLENTPKIKNDIENDLWNEASKVCGRNSKYDNTEYNKSEINMNWPWMVSLQARISGKYSHKCSASLLNSLWVMTVAHCVDMKPKSNFMLLLSNHDSDGKENYIEMEIDDIVIHPKFNRGMFENDLALLRMKTSVAVHSNVSPICLPWNIGGPKYGVSISFDWKLKHKQTSEDLVKLTVPIITNKECEDLYSIEKNKEKIKDTFLCAGKSLENCDSESGSSLIALNSEERWSLIGLVSWGSMCSNLEQPGVYIRISSYTQWIRDVIDCYEKLL